MRNERKQCKFWVMGAGIFFALVMMGQTAAANEAVQTPTSRIIVKFIEPNAAADQESLQELMTEHQVLSVKEFHAVRTNKGEDQVDRPKAGVKKSFKQTVKNSPTVSVIQFPDLSGIYILEVPDSLDVQMICDDFSNHPGVEYAYPDFQVKSHFSPDDTIYSEQWNLDRIQMEQAWDYAQGAGIIVAVIDTGVDYSHEDLSANIWVNTAETINGVDDDQNGFVDDVRGWDFVDDDNDPMDAEVHGTAVAGVIAAVGNNTQGISGVAPQAKMMVVRGLVDQNTGYHSDLARAIYYAVDNGADIINNSWGCVSPCPSSPILEDAVRYAHDSGVIIVSSAGDQKDYIDKYTPSNMKETITVGASKFDDKRKFNSNLDYHLDVLAPGVSIMTTEPGNIYVQQSGSSMAAAHVSGLAAVLLSYDRNLTNEEIRQIIRSSADDVDLPDFDMTSGFGRINAAKAFDINHVLKASFTEPVNNSTVDIIDDYILMSGTACEFDWVANQCSGVDINFNQYELYYMIYEGNGIWQSLGDPVSSPVDHQILASLDVQSLSDYSYLLRLVSTNNDGQTFEDIIKVTVVVSQGPVTPPVMELISDQSVTEGELIKFKIFASDEEFNHLVFTHPTAEELPQGAEFTVTTSEQGYLEGLFTWTPGLTQSGDYLIPFGVSDGVNETAQTAVIHVIHKIIPPPSVGLTVNLTQVNEGQELLITINGSSFAGLKNLWWHVEDVNHPRQQIIKGRVNGQDVNLFDPQDFNTVSGELNFSYSRNISFDSAGSYRIVVDAIDILDPVEGEIHQASIAGGEATDIITVNKVRKKHMKNNTINSQLKIKNHKKYIKYLKHDKHFSSSRVLKYLE